MEKKHTSIRFDSDLYEQIQRLADIEGITIGLFINKLLREALEMGIETDAEAKLEEIEQRLADIESLINR